MEVKNVPSWAVSELGSEDKKVTPFYSRGQRWRQLASQAASPTGFFF